MNLRMINKLKVTILLTCMTVVSILCLPLSVQAKETTQQRQEDEQSSTGWKFIKTTGTLHILDENAFKDGPHECEPGFKFFDSSAWEKHASKIKQIDISTKVTNLPIACFSNLPNLESIMIPDSVKLIDKYAFYNCTSLKEITIPDSVKDIGFETFFNCKSLETIKIGVQIKDIKENAFGGCVSLKKIYVKKKNPYLTVKHGVLYNNAQTKLIVCPANLTAIPPIPNTVNIIGCLAFANCKNLKTIQIPSSVKKIESGAFYNCTAMTKLIFKNNSKCKAINDFYRYFGDDFDETYGAFENCESLTTLTLPDKVTNIGTLALNNCKSLKTLSFGKNYGNNNDSIDLYKFAAPWSTYENLISLQEIKVSSKNKNYTTKNGILYNTSGTSLYIYPPAKKATFFSVPSKIKDIGTSAFKNNQNLVSINLSNVMTIDENAFENCKLLKNVTWSKKLNYIKDFAFMNCKELKTFISYGNRMKLNYNVFTNCKSLKIVILKPGTRFIGYEAFFNCPSLKQVTIPSSVTNIESYAFGYIEYKNNYKPLKNFIIYCKKNSEAYSYAKFYKFHYKFY